MATGKYYTFVIPQSDGIVKITGELETNYGFKVKQAPEGYMQFRQIGYDGTGAFVVEVRHEHGLGRTNHRFQLQLKSTNSPDPRVVGSIVSEARSDSEYIGG